MPVEPNRSGEPGSDRGIIIWKLELDVNLPCIEGSYNSYTVHVCTNYSGLIYVISVQTLTPVYSPCTLTRTVAVMLWQLS